MHSHCVIQYTATYFGSFVLCHLTHSHIHWLFHGIITFTIYTNCLCLFFSLIMWRQPQKTQRITTALTAALAISLVASFDLFSFLFALFVGYEFFLLSWLYHSFPKTLRFKGRFLRSLKTDAELTALQKAQEQEQQNPSTPTRATSGTSTQSALRRRLNRTPNNTTSGRASSRTHSESASSAPLDLSFIPIDSDLALRLAIPETELSALFVWKCLLINPQNKMKSRKGRLFLTHSYVIFQGKT